MSFNAPSVCRATLWKSTMDSGFTRPGDRAVLSRRHAVPGLELPVEVGQIVKAHALGDGEDLVVRLAQRLRREGQTAADQVGDEA